MAKVYLPQPIAPEGETFLLQQGYKLIHGDNPTPETFAREAADCDAILIRIMPCPASLLAAEKKLKIVARHGVGYDNIDIAAAEKLGIWVTNTPQALCHALDAGRPAFAVLDDQKQEPPEPDDPLLKREDVLLTPHMASNTEKCMARMSLHAAWQVHKVLSGDSPDWPVNHPVGVSE